MLQYLRAVPADGMVFCPGVLSYGRLVREAFDASVLMLLQTCFESTCRLADVYLSAGAWNFVDDVGLLLHREGVLDLSEERTESESGLEYRSDVEVLTHPPDPLTHASYVREVDSGWLIPLPFPVVLPWRLGSRGRTDKGTRITIPHEGFHEVVLLIPEVSPLLRYAPGAVVKTPYRTPLHMCWMMRPKVQVPVRVRLFTVYSDVKFTIFLPCYPSVKEGERPTLLNLHGEFYGWAYAV